MNRFTPLIIGVIGIGVLMFVVQNGKAIDSAACLQKNLTGETRPQCWERLIVHAIEQNGILAGFDVLSELYSKETDFRADCHGYTHIIGEKAYEAYDQGQEVALGAFTSACGYGFYHGFMERLLFESGNIEQAREFCRYVDAQLTLSVGGAFTACYHGIGHGIVDGSLPAAWGDAQALIAPGLEMCARVGETTHEKDLCGSGVFNSLAIMYRNEQYGLKTNREDPYVICKDQAQPYFTKPCYEEMNTLVLYLGDFDFVQAMLFVQKIEEDFYAQRATQSLAGYATNFLGQASVQELVALCRTIPDSFHTSCITGFVGGFMEFGAPGREYERTLSLCNTVSLSEEEKRSCFARLLWLSSIWYEKAKHQQICAIIDKKYHQHCPKEI